MALKLKDKQALKEWRAKRKLILENTDVNYNESKQVQAERIAKAKKDYRFFFDYYLPHYATSSTPSFHVKGAKRVKRHKTYKGWWQWGRGLGKSVVANVGVPLWLWINGDINFMVVIGQNEDKAKILLGDLQAEFESNQRLKHDFGDQENTGNWQDGFFKTKNGFIAKAIGMGQDPRGLRVVSQRPDYIVCDDWEIKETAKNPKRQNEYAKWLLRGVIPTMDDGNRRVILANNYFTPKMIFSIIIEESDAWDIYRVNAYDPVSYLPTWKEKYSKEHFKEIEQEIGILAAKAEYNNDPHIEGKIFTDQMIQWTKLPRLDHFTAIVGHWDVAYSGTSTSDYNAVRVWGVKDQQFYYITSFCKQSKIRAALEFMAHYQMSLPSSVHIHWRFEAQFWNDEIERVISEVESHFNISLNLVKTERPRKKKYDRILSLHPYYQNGRVWYNEKMKSHNDTKEGLAQLKAIEPGYKTHDDAPDADEQAIQWLSKFNSARKAPYRIGRRESRKF